MMMMKIMIMVAAANEKMRQELSCC